MDQVTHRGPYTIRGGSPAGEMETLGEAAQEAEFLHAERRAPQTVLDVDGWTAYESKGPPP